ALGNIWTAPFTFTDVGSWFLLVLGIMFSAVSFTEGIGWDDATLGYRRLCERLEDARMDVLHERCQWDTDARECFTRRVAELHDRAERVHYRVEALRNDVEQKRLLRAKAQNFFRYAVESCNTMMRIYRDLNRHHRKTPPPAYFQQPWKHPEPRLVDFDLGIDEVRIDTQEALRRDLDRCREGV